MNPIRDTVAPPLKSSSVADTSTTNVHYPWNDSLSSRSPFVSTQGLAAINRLLQQKPVLSIGASRPTMPLDRLHDKYFLAKNPFTPVRHDEHSSATTHRADNGSLRKTNSQLQYNMPLFWKLSFILAPFSALWIVCSCLGHMMGASGGRDNGQFGRSNDFNYRKPPTWNPANESYSFRAYVTDLMLWIMLTDLSPPQQASAIILQLEGTAREVARTIQPNEILFGGVINGQQLDPVSYVITGLYGRFGQLEEETRIAAMTEMLAFAKRSGENINAVLTRYELVRNRAATEGNFTM